MRTEITEHASEIASRAPQELRALVAVSSPSGDTAGAEAAFDAARALLPARAEIQRPQCSSPGHAPDLLAVVAGTGAGRLLLLGHVDTVVAHDRHRGLEAGGGRLTGSGVVDMKGGVVLALGVMRALATRPERFDRVALLLVCDEEWRTVPFVHAARFAGWDACLCFEAGQRDAEGREAVVVRRKVAGTLHVRAHGVAAHSGSAPERGRNALLALAEAARRVAATHDPGGPDHLTAVPTVLRSGDAFNVVPAGGELFCDLRADRLATIEAALSSVPGEHGGVRLESVLQRRWPGMDARTPTAPLLAAAQELLDGPLVAAARGGASDASHLASVIPVTVDGLGPRGGLAHNPGEYVDPDSLRPRAEVALAVAAAALRAGPERR